jgi:asparagine synthase (glutamine-hydrolysing)
VLTALTDTTIALRRRAANAMPAATRLWRTTRARRGAERRSIGRLSRRVIDERLTYLGVGGLRTLERYMSDVDGHDVPGDVIEAGVALGGSAIVLVDALRADRQFHGFDVFAMIPPPSEHDPPEVHARYRTIREGRSAGIGGDTYYGYRDDLYEQVVATFARHGHPVDGQRVHLRRGLFEDTLRPQRPVALAHVDCDWFEPVQLCLRRIWPVLSPGGVMIFDDYNAYGGCTAAVDAFVHESADAELVQTDPTAVVRKSRAAGTPSGSGA